MFQVIYLLAVREVDTICADGISGPLKSKRLKYVMINMIKHVKRNLCILPSPFVNVILQNPVLHLYPTIMSDALHVLRVSILCRHLEQHATVSGRSALGKDRSQYRPLSSRAARPMNRKMTGINDPD